MALQVVVAETARLGEQMRCARRNRRDVEEAATALSWFGDLRGLDERADWLATKMPKMPKIPKIPKVPRIPRTPTPLQPEKFDKLTHEQKLQYLNRMWDAQAKARPSTSKVPEKK